MRDLGIHWKGYPHHRLPRIRVVSTRRNSALSRRLSNPGHSSSTSSTFRLRNEKENKKRSFGIKFRRRRAPVSRAASSVVRSRRRASARARYNIQVFGWDKSGAEFASKATTEIDFESGYCAPTQRLKPRTTLRSHLREDSGIPSTDGAASSAARPVKPSKSSDAYSSRQLAKVPGYWTADHPSQKKSNFNPDRLYSAQRSVPLQEASNRISIRPSQAAVERARTYDIRVDPRSLERRQSLSRPQFKQNTFRRATSQVSPGRKTTRAASSELLQAVQTVQDYSQESREAHGTPAPSVKSIVQTLVSENDSRSPSQKKALARFTRGIELYLQATKSFPKQSLVSSPSFSVRIWPSHSLLNNVSQDL